MVAERTNGQKEPKRAPLWLRVVLMILLLLAVCYAFYVTNIRILEQLNRP